MHVFIKVILEKCETNTRSKALALRNNKLIDTLFPHVESIPLTSKADGVKCNNKRHKTAWSNGRDVHGSGLLSPPHHHCDSFLVKSVTAHAYPAPGQHDSDDF